MTSVASLRLLSEDWLEAVNGALDGISLPDTVDGVAQFRVTGAPTGRPVTFLVTVKDGEVTVAKGWVRDADTLLIWKYSDFVAVWSGELSLEAAYMTGRVKVERDRVLLIDGWRPLRMSPEVHAALSDLASTS